MSKCKKCNVTILDDTDVCPLCRCVIEKDDNVENKYPDILEKQEKFKLAVRIYAFFAIVLECALVYINYKTGSIWWSVITGCALAYIYLTLAVFIDSERIGYRVKTLVGAIALIGMIGSIDIVTGNLHWSFNYVMPGVFLAVDFAIILLILFINRRFWQSYLAVQIWMIAFSVAQYLLFAIGLATDIRVINISVLASLGCFLGTLIIGGQRAVNELKRRFHF